MPHRVTTFKRHRISNDVLILILEKLNPVTLYRTCQVSFSYDFRTTPYRHFFFYVQAFQRVWMLVMEIQSLRYIFELAVVGMKDGAAPYSGRSHLIRLQLLMTYKKDWPRLYWTDEKKVSVPATATKVDVSGNFLYYAGHQSLDLLELPSCRTSRPPAQTRHLKYITSAADHVAIDPTQSLIVASQVTGYVLWLNLIHMCLTARLQKSEWPNWLAPQDS